MVLESYFNVLGVWIAPILVSGIAAMILGGLWYSPLLFGKSWMKMLGMTEKDMGKMKNEAVKGYIIGFVAALVMAHVLAFVSLVFVNSGGVYSRMLEEMEIGFLLWLGFIAPVILGGWLWEGKPFKLFLINAGYYLISMLIMSSIFAAWPLPPLD
ncbi:DUF1761 domain-containing protein [Candidatus Peregrinibacteria bacterium]|nr:DUF1761 domain-containing protein [Candidatus Peregrinibacteria bacterium]